jgi:hypothetical protein
MWGEMQHLLDQIEANTERILENRTPLLSGDPELTKLAAEANRLLSLANAGLWESVKATAGRST